MFDQKIHNINLEKAPAKVRESVQEGLDSPKKEYRAIGELHDYIDEYLSNRPWYKRIWDRVRGVGYRAQNIADNVKHIYQRSTRGYSDIDIWGPGLAIIEFAYPLVNAFYQKMKEGKTYGTPVAFCKANGDSDPEAWEKVVAKITRALELQYNYEVHFGEDIDELHQALIDNDPKKKKYKALSKEIDEGMALFGKYLLALWD